MASKPFRFGPYPHDGHGWGEPACRLCRLEELEHALVFALRKRDDLKRYADNWRSRNRADLPKLAKHMEGDGFAEVDGENKVLDWLLGTLDTNDWKIP